MEKTQDAQAPGEVGGMCLSISPLCVCSRHPGLAPPAPWACHPQGPGRRDPASLPTSQKTHWFAQVMCSPQANHGSWNNGVGILIGQVEPTDEQSHQKHGEERSKVPQMSQCFEMLPPPHLLGGIILILTTLTPCQTLLPSALQTSQVLRWDSYRWMHEVSPSTATQD